VFASSRKRVRRVPQPRPLPRLRRQRWPRLPRRGCHWRRLHSRPRRCRRRSKIMGLTRVSLGTACCPHHRGRDRPRKPRLLRSPWGHLRSPRSRHSRAPGPLPFDTPHTPSDQNRQPAAERFAERASSSKRHLATRVPGPQIPAKPPFPRHSRRATVSVRANTSLAAPRAGSFR